MSTYGGRFLRPAVQHAAHGITVIMETHNRKALAFRRLNAKLNDERGGALVLFTKVPKAGLVKTRFVARSGAPSSEEATFLYLHLLEDSLAAVSALKEELPITLIVSFTPAEGEQTIKSLVERYVAEATYLVQQGRDVTRKVRNAFDFAFNLGYRNVCLIPGDHPDLSGALLAESFRILTSMGEGLRPAAVVGPTSDGGAYLIGFNKEGFHGIDFSLENTYKVCADIITKARAKNVSYYILESRNDIDDWDDARLFLRSAEYRHTKTYSFLSTLKMPASKDAYEVSIVVPTLNEEKTISRSLKSVKASYGADFETIVVDGGSSDSTAERAMSLADKLAFTRIASRKSQENTGAIAARGRVLLFLHADMLLPPNLLQDLVKAIDDPEVLGGSCTVVFEGEGFKLRFLDALRKVGGRLLRIHGISSAFFVRRKAFLEVGGFREGVMEEAVDLQRRLRGRGKFVTIDQVVVSSSRRFQGRNSLFVAIIWVLTVAMTAIGLHFTSVERKLWKAVR